MNNLPIAFQRYPLERDTCVFTHDWKNISPLTFNGVNYCNVTITIFDDQRAFEAINKMGIKEEVGEERIFYPVSLL